MAKKVEYSVEERLRALYDLQLIDSRIDKLRSVRGELPLEVEDLEDEVSNLPNDKAPMERMDYEKELLTIMMEECGEVIQACSKIIRFGATHESLSHLEKELGDLYQMMELAHQYDLVSWTKIDEASDKKREKLATWSSLVDI